MVFNRRRALRVACRTALLGTMLALVYYVTATFTTLARCSYDPSEERPNVTTEEVVLNAVRQIYLEQGLQVPLEMEIIDRTEGAWRVRVGPEIREFEVDVDPKSGTILRVYPGD